MTELPPPWYKEGGDFKKIYTHADTGWKDKLTAFNGSTITYDTIGNPLQYRDGMTFTWVDGRKLGTLTKDGVTTTYTYDGDGNRIRKQSGAVTVEYTVVDGVIYAEKRTENGVAITFHYLFDESGNRFGFVLNGTEYYYYRFNLQGDVTGIYDTNGNLVTEYGYDAWGKLLSVTGNNTTLGNLNPIRYRGYYYDAESEFYYLQTRFYDPETCRFISADAYLSTGQGLLGHNMYAYCLNNPVCFMDPSGAIVIESAAAVSISGLGVVVGIVVVVALFDPNVQAGISEGVNELYSNTAEFVDSVRDWVAPKAVVDQVGSNEKSVSVSTTQIMTKPDWEPIYYGAETNGYLSLKFVTGPMNLYEAIQWTITIELRAPYGKNSKWGVYTHHKSDAELMAIMLSVGEIPEIHKGKYGTFSYFHVHNYIFLDYHKHFHIWYNDRV